MRSSRLGNQVHGDKQLYLRVVACGCIHYIVMITKAQFQSLLFIIANTSDRPKMHVILPYGHIIEFAVVSSKQRLQTSIPVIRLWRQNKFSRLFKPPRIFSFIQTLLPSLMPTTASTFVGEMASPFSLGDIDESCFSSHFRLD